MYLAKKSLDDALVTLNQNEAELFGKLSGAGNLGEDLATQLAEVQASIASVKNSVAAIDSCLSGTGSCSVDYADVKNQIQSELSSISEQLKAIKAYLEAELTTRVSELPHI